MKLSLLLATLMVTAFAPLDSVHAQGSEDYVNQNLLSHNPELELFIEKREELKAEESCLLQDKLTYTYNLDTVNTNFRGPTGYTVHFRCEDSKGEFVERIRIEGSILVDGQVYYRSIKFYEHEV